MVEMAKTIKFIKSITDPLYSFNLILSSISIFINILHVIILTRSSMKSSSMNVIMIGISIVDIFILSLTVIKYISLVDVENNECVTSDNYLKVYFDMLVWALQDYFRRCSTWLGLLMATVRTMIVTNIVGTNNSCLTRKKFGWMIVLSIMIFASTLSIFYNFRFTVTENNSTNLPISCEEYQDNQKPPKYSLVMTAFFLMNDKIVLRIYLMVDAVLSKFIPCILFPIMTILLIQTLKRARTTEQKSLNHNDHATKLVIFMTVAFFVAEAPFGVIYMINAFNLANEGLIMVSVDFLIFFACLLTINSTCHFFLCISLCEQYRSTICFTLRLDKLVSSNTLKHAETQNLNCIAAPPIRMVSVQ